MSKRPDEKFRRSDPRGTSTISRVPISQSSGASASASASASGSGSGASADDSTYSFLSIPPDLDPSAFVEFERSLDGEQGDSDGTAQGQFVQMISHTSADLRWVHDRLKHYVQDWIPSNRTELLESQMQEMDIVPREVEEAYLRVAMPGEPKCCRGANCRGMKMNVDKPQPLLAFHSERVKQAKSKAGEALPPALCIMCTRYLAQTAVFAARSEGGILEKQGPTRSNAMVDAVHHANYVNRPGEYSGDQVVETGTPETHGLFLHIVIHCDHWYTPDYDDKGILWFRQTGYKTVVSPPERLDF